MRKHLYFHTSNLENIRELRDDVRIEGVHSYPEWEAKLAHPNEYGRITSAFNFYHFLVGHIRKTTPKCAWCDDVLHLKVKEYEKLNIVDLGLQCYTCGSTGPAYRTTKSDFEREIIKEHIKEFMNFKYQDRKQWDHDLKNPYDHI